MECQIVVPFRFPFSRIANGHILFLSTQCTTLKKTKVCKCSMHFNFARSMPHFSHFSLGTLSLFCRIYFGSIRKKILGYSKDFLTCGQLKALSRFWGSDRLLCSSNVAYAQCARSHLYLSAVLAWVGFRSSLVRPANPGIRRCLVRLTLRLDLLPFIRHHQLLRAVLRSRCLP